MNGSRLLLALAILFTPDVVNAQNLEHAIEVGIGSDRLSANNDRDYDNWRAGYLAYEQRFSDDTLVYGRYQATERFAQTDGEWQLGSYIDLNPNWQAQLEVGVSPTARVRPEHYATIWLRRQLADGYGVSLGLHRNAWRNSTSQGYSGRVERYLGQWRWAYTLRHEQLQNTNASALGHVGELSYYYGPHNSAITVAVNSGQELEKINVDQVVETDTTGIAWYGLHYTSARWGWRWALTWQAQGDYYDRLGGQIGVRYRF